MKAQVNPSCRMVLFLAVILFSHIRLIQAQPGFPNPDIQSQQTHEGDLILTGNQTMTIENTAYKVNGNIMLQDSSQLIIRQSIVETLGDIGRSGDILLQGFSLLKADTTIFGGLDLTQGIDPSEVEMIKSGNIVTDANSKLIMNNCFSLTQSFMGNSKVTVRNSYLVQEPLGLVHVEGNADVLFEDSFVGALFLPIPDYVPIVIDSLQPGYLEYWSLRERISDVFSYNLVLRRTEVMENTKGYKGGMEMGWNIAVDALKTNITISNSKLNKLIIGFPDSEPAFISDLVTRQPTNFDLNNIHVINTEIQTQWGIFMNGGPAQIINSQGLFIFMNGGNADIFVANSEVGEIDPRNYTGTLIYENSTWLGGYEIMDTSYIKIRGSVRMLPTVPIFDETSTMTRTYEVYLLDDADESPFANVNLTLSKDGIAVWSGITDAEGKVSFDIAFDYDNSQDEWILSTDASHIKLNKTFSIYISNPVKISLELEEDGENYRSVLHVAENKNFPFGTRESPYPTIQEGIDNSGGDIVYVHPGIYTGDIPPGKTRGGIALKDSVTIFGAGADSTILAGGVSAEEVSGAHISGFTIEDGIHALSSSLSLTNCVIADYAGAAIWGTHTDFQIVNNVLADNSQDAVFLHDSSTAIIKNNIIVNNTGFGINGVESALATIDYNDFWGNTENYFELFPAGEHDISNDPLFVDAGSGDFHLQSGSPCVDAGDPDSQFNDPDGSRNDMGAFGGPFAPNIITGIGNDDLFIPDQVALFQNYPNPFNAQTSMRFELPNDEWINLSVYNIIGQRVRTLLDEQKKAGQYTVSWDGTDENGHSMGNGIYFYRISANDFKYTKKALLLK